LTEIFRRSSEQMSFDDIGNRFIWVITRDSVNLQW